LQGIQGCAIQTTVPWNQEGEVGTGILAAVGEGLETSAGLEAVLSARELGWVSVW